MRILSLCAATALLVPAPAAVAQETVQLQLEVRRGDAVVARPSLALSVDSEGSLDVDGLGTIKLTPTRLEPDRLSITFDITVGDRRMQPRLVLKGAETGSISINPEAGGEPVQIAVTWRH